jgi:uncharacterized integral membrane protein
MIEDMGDTTEFQPLTKQDRISVIIYRAGIVLSAISIALGAFLLFTSPSSGAAVCPVTGFLVLLISLYVSVGLSVFFIHLYISKFHRGLKKLYYAALACLLLLFFLSGGDLPGAFTSGHYLALLLLPLSGCLGFITAKEAFCFKLMEGYILALVMPAYLVLVASGQMTARGAAFGLVFIAALLLLFTLRKVSMPLHYDIGDKSAYQ